MAKPLRDADMATPVDNAEFDASAVEPTVSFTEEAVEVTQSDLDWALWQA